MAKEPTHSQTLLGTMDKKDYIVDAFSADGLCPQEARQALEQRYTPILEITKKFDRRSVSYQLSKKNALHSWLKYKEGFSADLVNILLDEMGAVPGDIILDPFLGAGTTALVCQLRGINSIGYDILPLSKVAITAKANSMSYNLEELRQMLHRFTQLVLPEGYSKKTPYINITCGAYPEHNAKYIQFATEWIDQSDFSEIAKNLFTLCMINSLERCSYTSKSGQYLSWDSRSEKIIDVNRRREEAGKKPLAQHTCRKVIEDSRDAVADELRHVLSDLETIQGSGYAGTPSAIHYTQGSALFQLPQVEDGFLKGVITSPPYCNRYDYTRTYALELAYLGVDEKGIK